MHDGSVDDPEYPAVTEDAKNWGMLCHLSALLGWLPATPVFGSVIAPLALWAIKGKDHPFIDLCGKESLNFQLSMLIYSVLLLPTLCIVIGFVLIPLIWLIDAFFVVYASLKASQGIVYRYPLSLRLIS